MSEFAIEPYLKETEFLDFSHPSVISFIEGIEDSTQKKTAINAYYKVRDFQLYDPYHLNLRPEALKVSYIICKKRAWCVEKTILLTSCLRALKIPARMGFAIVKNHIGVEKLIEYLRKDEIVFHGFVEVYLNGKWIKCTPAFDKRICTLQQVEPLAFDGEHDSMFQAYTEKGQFMEYLHFYGVFDDVPIALMKSEMQQHYPHLFMQEYNSKSFSFLY